MNKAWKILRDVILTICCLTTLCVGVLLVTQFDHVQKIVRTITLIESKYLWDSDADTLTEGAVRGMLDSLGDKYTTYIDADTMTGFMEQVSGDVYGIGVYTAEDEQGRLVILSPMTDSPAEKAGFCPGDMLIASQGESAAGIQWLEALLRTGEDPVPLTLRRDGEEMQLNLPVK